MREKKRCMQVNPKRSSAATRFYRKHRTANKCVQCQTAKVFSKGVQCALPKIDISLLPHNDKLVKAYTGVNTYKLFQILCKYLLAECDPKTCNIKEHNLVCKISENFTFISVENQILLTLYKLKTNHKFSSIASSFSISKGSSSEIFHYWIGRMFRKFKLINTDATLEQVQQYMSDNFKSRFPTVREIFDATEVQCQKPSDPVAQKQLWSNYKHSHTIKTQIGCTPNGVISSISDTYGGLISDKKLFIKSGRLNVLNSGEAIMTDKGYLLADVLQSKGVRLIRPPFLSGKKQFNNDERNVGREIARSRIVIENVNSRVKCYKILKDKIPVTLLHMVNEIFFVCCFLSNMCKPFHRNV